MRLDAEGASRIGPHGMVPIGPRPSHPAKKHVSQVKSEEQPDWVSVAALLALSPHEALPSRLVPATAGCIGDFCGPPTRCEKWADRLGHATKAGHALVELLSLLLALRGALSDPSTSRAG